MRDESPEQLGDTRRAPCLDGPLDGAVVTWVGEVGTLAVIAYQDHGVYLPSFNAADELTLVWVPEA